VSATEACFLHCYWPCETQLGSAVGVHRLTHASSAERASSANSKHIGRTPLVQLHLRIGAHWSSIWLKLEQFNPGGSIKDRTAYSLIEDLEYRGLLGPGDRVIESTSGNLGIGLSYICRERGYQFTAMVDPTVSEISIGMMQQLGASVEYARDPDETGSYLLSRLEKVREKLCTNPSYVSPNQYRNPANPRVHREQTAVEIVRQIKRVPSTIFVGVSTGGTLVGIAQYVRVVAPACRIMAVDVRGSSALGGSPGPRHISGLGSRRLSEFVTESSYDEIHYVSDAEAFIACHKVRMSTRLGVGGSSGAVIAAAARYLRATRDPGPVICVCPDGADRYEGTIYRRQWIEEIGIDIDNPLLSYFQEAALGEGNDSGGWDNSTLSDGSEHEEGR